MKTTFRGDAAIRRARRLPDYLLTPSNGMKYIKAEEQDPIQARGYSKQILLDADDLQSAGARVQIVTILPGNTVAAHVHQTAREFYLVLQGRCRLTVNEETSLLQPGDMLLMEPGDVHSLHNPGKTPFLVMVFKTNGENDTHWV